MAGISKYWNTASVNGKPFTKQVSQARNVRHVYRPIESIRRGDLVLAEDPETGEVAHKHVTAVFRRVSDHLRILELRGTNGEIQTLKTTDEHPFWGTGRGWIDAGKLKVGDHVKQDDGEPALLVATTRQHHPEGIPVYNIETEDFHTYLVASHDARAPPVLVHNCNNPRRRRRS